MIFKDCDSPSRIHYSSTQEKLFFMKTGIFLLFSGISEEERKVLRWNMDEDHSQVAAAHHVLVIREKNWGEMQVNLDIAMIFKAERGRPKADRAKCL